MLNSSKTRFLILVIYWITGFILTHIPMRESGQVLIPNLDKIAHFVLYSGLSVFIAFWLGLNRTTQKTIWLTLVICLIFAVIDEGVQAFVPTRNASLADWAADAIGSLAGISIYGLLRSSFSNSSAPPNHKDD